MCENCIPVALPVNIWEIIDAAMCAELARKEGLTGVEDQLRAKIREAFNEWPTEYYLGALDRIRTDIFGPEWKNFFTENGLGHFDD